MSSVPPHLQTMRDITGTLETPGSADNPVILGWCREIGERFPEMAAYCTNYTHDSIPWCGLTVAYCMAHNGIRPVFGPTDTDKFLWAQAWKQFGDPVDQPQLGDVLVLAGHVTLYDGEDGDHYFARGGNQSDAVTVMRIAKSSVEASRRSPEATVVVTEAWPRSGRGSWYSQYRGKYTWIDNGDAPGSAALGCPDEAQGVSFYDRSTLGSWFLVEAPNGVASLEQQTDIGPSPRTGRTIDISAAAAERFGYTPRNFPTDGIFRWRPAGVPVTVAHLSPKEQASAYYALRQEPTMPDNSTTGAPTQVIPTVFVPQPSATAQPSPIFDFARWAEVAHSLERGAATFAAAADRLVALQTGQAAPPPAAPAPTPALQLPSVQLGTAGLVIGGILQLLGIVGPPTGTTATTAGTLTTAIPAAITAIGATGGFGSILKLLGALVKIIPK